MNVVRKKVTLILETPKPNVLVDWPPLPPSSLTLPPRCPVTPRRSPPSPAESSLTHPTAVVPRPARTPLSSPPPLPHIPPPLLLPLHLNQPTNQPTKRTLVKRLSSSVSRSALCYQRLTLQVMLDALAPRSGDRTAMPAPRVASPRASDGSPWSW